MLIHFQSSWFSLNYDLNWNKIISYIHLMIPAQAWIVHSTATVLFSFINYGMHMEQRTENNFNFLCGELAI